MLLERSVGTVGSTNLSLALPKAVRRYFRWHAATNTYMSVGRQDRSDMSAGFRGFEFERLVLDLFSGLGYEVLGTNKEIPCAFPGKHRKENLHEFDLLIEHGKGKRFILPPFSPKGRTLVECKTWPMSKSVFVDDLAELIECVNAYGKYGKIDGGVLISGKAIEDEALDRAKELGLIYCWDLNRLLFYTAKVFTFNEFETWAEMEPDSKIVEENLLDIRREKSAISSIIGIRPRITEKVHDLRFAYFCDCLAYPHERQDFSIGSDLLEAIGKDFIEIMTRMRADGQTFRISADLEFHSLSGYKADVKRRATTYVKRWELSMDEVEIKNIMFYDYELASWHALLREVLTPPDRVMPREKIDSLLIRLQAQALRRAAEKVLSPEDERYVKMLLDRFRKRPPHISKLTWWSDIHPDVEVSGRHLDLYVHYRPRWPFFIPTLAFVVCNRNKRPINERDLVDTIAYARFLKDEKKVMRLWISIASNQGFTEDTIKYCKDFEKRDVGLVLVDTRNNTIFSSGRAQSQNAIKWLGM